MVSASGLSMNLVENGVPIKGPTFKANLVHGAKIEQKIDSFEKLTFKRSYRRAVRFNLVLSFISTEYHPDLLIWLVETEFSKSNIVYTDTGAKSNDLGAKTILIIWTLK